MSEEPRVAAGTWEEWLGARTEYGNAEFDCGEWDDDSDEPYTVVHEAAKGARERLDTLHRAALARIAELEREVAARGKVIDIALNSAATLIDGEAHRAALEERDALRLLLIDTQRFLPNPSLVEAGPPWMRELNGRKRDLHERIDAALRSTVPAEPSLASASSPSGSDARAGSGDSGADSGRSTSTAERV